MASDANKKLYLLYILDVLKEYSDENHLLLQSDIISLIEKNYNVTLERKAVSRNIDFLTDFGYSISKSKGGYCLLDREFDSSEITFLIDSVFSNRFIPVNSANRLVKKLANNLSKYERKNYSHIFKVVSNEQNENKQYFYNIDLISRAIESKKQITFKYLSYKIDGLKLETVEKLHTVSPYFMINNNGKYYLVCNKSGYDSVGNYKIDCIKDIKMTDEHLIPITCVTGFANGISEQQYIKEHIYMFNGESVKAKIELLDNKAVSAVYDWFGKGSKILNDGNKMIALVNANEQALIYWALQYGEVLKIVEPLNLKQKVVETLKVINKNYS